ncbi:hypothetical protein LBMAG53_26240 [Planctomycetota bacterium]|nr:hypothetical protein LBMAG53_26240 [Planctomycetota bacterium]
MTAQASPARCDDTALLSAWRQRHDEESFQVLCQRHWGFIISTCRRLASPDPDEAAQAVFILLARRPQAVGDPGHLIGWLLGTARWVVAHQHRAARRRRRYEQEAAMEQTRNRDAEPVDWSQAKPILDRALLRLTTARREALVRYYLEGKTQAAVATELGCSVDAVKTRIHEGLEQLRACLARQGLRIGIGALASGLASECGSCEPASPPADITTSNPGPATTLANGVHTAMVMKSAIIAACACATGLVLITGTFALVMSSEPATPTTELGSSAAPSPAPPAMAVVITPRHADANRTFHELRLLGGPNVSINRPSAQGPRLLIPVALRFQPISGERLVEAVAAANGMKTIWGPSGRTVCLYQGAIGDAVWQKDPEQDLPRLELALREKKDGLWRSVSNLAIIGGRKATAILEKLMSDPDPDVRRATAFWVGREGGVEATAIKEKALADPVAKVRWSAADGLGTNGIGGERCLPALSSMLADPDPDMRRLGAWALGSWGGERTLALLSKALADPKPEVRTTAMRTMPNCIRSDTALPFLRKCLADQDPVLRQVAAFSLGRIGGDQAVELLAASLADPIAAVRSAAVAALGNIGDSRALGMLKNSLADLDPEVRKAAIDALGDVGNEQSQALLRETQPRPSPAQETKRAAENF